MRLLETAHFWAAQLGQSDKTVRRALGDTPPDGTRGETQPRYYLSTVFNSLMNLDGDLDANRERARKDKEMADKYALENRVRRGELLESQTVEREYGQFVISARARLIQLPDAIGQFCPPAVAASIVAETRKRVHEALSDLARSPVQAMDAAADVDGERMGGPGAEAIKRKQRRAGPMAN